METLLKYESKLETWVENIFVLSILVCELELKAFRLKWAHNLKIKEKAKRRSQSLLHKRFLQQLN